MPQFQIDCKIRACEPTFDVRSRLIFKLELNDEWAIVFALSQDQSDPQIINSIEIHRKNTTGEFLVSGELTVDTFCTKKGPITKYFSQFIKTGSSFIEITSNINLRIIVSVFWSVGYVNISAISGKQVTSSANGESKERIQLKSLEELSKDFERILDPESSCLADVTLICGGTSVPAHKIILSARSPVFAAMFANPMKESLKNEVDITDIDVSILRALLMYIYTGKTSDLTVSSAADLLFAADKYQLQDLKTVCTYFLKDAVSLQSVWKILVLGDMHSEDLKSFAADYICNKSGEFSVLENTEEWKSLRKERPDLAMDLLESLVKYRDGKLKR